MARDIPVDHASTGDTWSDTCVRTYVLVERGHAIRINGELAMAHIRLAGTPYKDGLPELIDIGEDDDQGTA